MPIKKFNHKFRIIQLIILSFVIHSGSTYANNIDSLLKLCNTYLENHENEKAFVVELALDKEIDLNVEEEDLAHYLLIKSSLVGNRGLLKEQEEYLIKFAELAKKLKNPKLIGSGLIAYGNYYDQFGDSKKALPYFLKALDEFVKLNDEIELAYLYNKLGLFFYIDKDYNKSKAYFSAAFVLFKKHEKESVTNAYWIQNCLSNIGLCYQQLYLPKRALAYMKIALEYCKTAPFKRERPIGVIKTNMGVIYSDLGNFKLALKNLLEGIEICLNPKNLEIGHGIESLVYLTNVYTRMGKYKEAKESLNRAKYLIDKEKYEQYLDFYYIQLAKLSSETGDFKTAYLAQIKYDYITDSLDIQMEKSTFSSQISLHNLEKQKMENKILQQENEYQSLLNKVEIGFGVISMLVILLFYLNLNKSKSKNQELIVLNEKVNAQKSDLERLNATLEKINQNKSFLIQSVAHDLRTPIGNVLSINNFQLEHLDHSKEALNFQELIESSCLLALNIIEDILDQSMIERGKLKLKITPNEIQKVILETRSLLLFKSNPKEINITTELESPLTVDIDSERIKRVLINLLVNAIKFSPNHSTIHIRQWKSDTSCFMSISDQGIGMSKEILAHIFEKNTKSAREGLQKEQTIGIGLSITKSIIEEHGGSIKVESTPDSGSTFYIELPISASL